MYRSLIITDQILKNKITHQLKLSKNVVTLSFDMDWVGT